MFPFMFSYQPTAEDIELYRAHSTYPECLTTIDQFMLRLCEIPKLSLRIDLTLALWIFPSNYLTLREVRMCVHDGPSTSNSMHVLIWRISLHISLQSLLNTMLALIPYWL